MANKSNNKRKFTFNIIDALIILILIAVIALIVYVFILGKDLKDLIPKNENSKEAVEIIEPIKSEEIIISNIEFNENIGENLL